MSSQDEPEFLSPDTDALTEQHAAPGEDNADTPVAKVLKEHHDALMARPGVVMIGETIDAIGRPAIMIGVKTARGLGKLPQEIDGVPIVAQVIGEIDVQ